MTEADAMELVAVLMASYPYAKPSAKTYEVYERAILDLDAKLAQHGVSRLIATSKFLPTIAEIRAAAVEVQQGARRLGGEAWGDLNMAVRMYGRYQSPRFSDPVTAEVVRQLGWLNICDSTNDTADRARFIELYDGLAARERKELVAGPLNALPCKNEKTLKSRNVGMLTADIGLMPGQQLKGAAE